MAHRSNLTGDKLGEQTLTVFALGGSGIRAVEPILHLCAFGLGPRRLKLVLIDPDQSNAAISRVRRLLDRYHAVREHFAQSTAPGAYFHTEILETSGRTAVWSPIADDEHRADARFASRVDRSRMFNAHSERLGQLFDLLYSRRIQDMDLGLGFRGVPAIGTVFMNRLRGEPFLEEILTEAESERGSLFFSIGSIFGGTGAAAFPVIGRALIDGLQDDPERTAIPGVQRERIGGALLLPYFTLPTPDSARAPDGGIRPETALFAQNAAAAIPEYTGGRADYSELYVLGDSFPREQRVNAVGGEQQENPAHYIELYAALAALDFAERRGRGEPAADHPTFHISTVAGEHIRWSDLPIDAAAQHRFMGGIVAAHTILTLFWNDGATLTDLDERLRGMTWLDCLDLRAGDLEQRTGPIDALGRFFEMTWEWLVAMRRSTPALQLIQSGEQPSAVRLDELIEGRRPSGRRLKLRHQYDVFRHWNLAAYRRKERGFAGFPEVMRQGSEGFAQERFSELATEPAR
jgi:hypothetical protein